MTMITLMTMMERNKIQESDSIDIRNVTLYFEQVGTMFCQTLTIFITLFQLFT